MLPRKNDRCRGRPGRENQDWGGIRNKRARKALLPSPVKACRVITLKISGKKRGGEYKGLGSNGSIRPWRELLNHRAVQPDKGELPLKRKMKRLKARAFYKVNFRGDLLVPGNFSVINWDLEAAKTLRGK